MKNLAREYQAVVNAPFGAVGIIMDEGILTKIDLFPAQVRFSAQMILRLGLQQYFNAIFRIQEHPSK